MLYKINIFTYLPQVFRIHQANREERTTAFHYCSLSAKKNQVSNTESGLSETLSMPLSISHLAKSGWSEGPCPQIPMYLFAFLQALIAFSSKAKIAGLRSSNRCAIIPESRSSPRVNWVKSFEPTEKPSKCSKKI